MKNFKCYIEKFLDYAMEFTDVTAYNSTLTDSTAVNSSMFSNIYKTILNGAGNHRYRLFSKRKF